MDPLMPSPNLSISYKHSTSHHLKSYLWKETETVCFVPSPSRFTAEIVLLSTLDTRNLICTWQGRGSLACMATTRRSGAQRALQPNDQVYVPDHGIEPIIFPLRVQIDFLGWSTRTMGTDNFNFSNRIRTYNKIHIPTKQKTCCYYVSTRHIITKPNWNTSNSRCKLETE